MMHDHINAIAYDADCSDDTLVNDVLNAWKKHQPWVGWCFSNSDKHNDVREMSRTFLTRALSALNQAPIALQADQLKPSTPLLWHNQPIQISLSYARNLCVFGLSLGEAGFGIDVEDADALKNWSITEMDDVAHLYFTLAQITRMQKAKANKLLCFAQEWATYEASVKANHRAGICENTPVEIGHVQAIDGLPNGLVSVCVRMD